MRVLHALVVNFGTLRHLNDFPHWQLGEYLHGDFVRQTADKIHGQLWHDGAREHCHLARTALSVRQLE